MAQAAVGVIRDQPEVAARNGNGRYRFGEYRLCTQQRKLWRGSVPVAITPRALDLLTALVRSPGRMLSREELLHKVWGGIAVQDSNLTVNLCLLRRALGAGQRYIATLPGRGYQFVEPVIAEIGGEQAEASAAWLAVRRFECVGSPGRYSVLGQAVVPVLLAQLRELDGVRLLPMSAASDSADWRLEGSYQVLDGQVRITAQLVSGEGAVAWAGRRDFAAVASFELQDEIAAWLRTGIRLPRAR